MHGPNLGMYSNMSAKRQAQTSLGYQAPTHSAERKQEMPMSITPDLTLVNGNSRNVDLHHKLTGDDHVNHNQRLNQGKMNVKQAQQLLNNNQFSLSVHSFEHDQRRKIVQNLVAKRIPLTFDSRSNNTQATKIEAEKPQDKSDVDDDALLDFKLRNQGN